MGVRNFVYCGDYRGVALCADDLAQHRPLVSLCLWTLGFSGMARCAYVDSCRKYPVDLEPIPSPELDMDIPQLQMDPQRTIRTSDQRASCCPKSKLELPGHSFLSRSSSSPADTSASPRATIAPTAAAAVTARCVQQLLPWLYMRELPSGAMLDPGRGVWLPALPGMRLRCPPISPFAASSTIAATLSVSAALSSSWVLSRDLRRWTNVWLIL
mmetsp:Transcript_23156/g.68354  ORF Transcript_23156/g.68354 Transcript_23156/m.68354 type:complete len:213 (+) Transcript_23156:328-966(+)